MRWIELWSPFVHSIISCWVMSKRNRKFQPQRESMCVGNAWESTSEVIDSSYLSIDPTLVFSVYGMTPKYQASDYRSLRKRDAPLPTIARAPKIFEKYSPLIRICRRVETFREIWEISMQTKTICKCWFVREKQSRSKPYEKGQAPHNINLNKPNKHKCRGGPPACQNI